jgi:hypothetical protein
MLCRYPLSLFARHEFFSCSSLTLTSPKLYSVAYDGIIRLWDFEDGVLLKVPTSSTWQ